MISRMLLLASALALPFALPNPVYGKQKSGTEQVDESGIQWRTDYNTARVEAERSGKPLFVLFTGSDWCGWCMRLEREVLTQRNFGQRVSNQYIFVKADFPIYQTLPEEQVNQNQELKKRFKVRGYPTVLLLDAQERRIDTTGYRPGGPELYADYLFQVTTDHQELRAAMSALQAGEEATGADLEKLFKKARRLGEIEDQETLLELGLKATENTFFLVERYRRLVEAGEMQSEEAVSLRNNILATKEDTAELCYQLAVIDFQGLSDTLAKTDDPTPALEPLLQYLREYESTDARNSWKVNMMTSQVFLSRGRLNQALKHSKSAYHSAPQSFRGDIAQVIDNIQVEMESRG